VNRLNRFKLLGYSRIGVYDTAVASAQKFLDTAWRFGIRLGFIALFVSGSAAQEWTRFRGPNGSGISESKTIPTKITDADLNWKIELPGSGYSSPVLWGEKIFLTCTGDKAGGISVLCLDAKAGKTFWQRDFPLSPFSHHALNSFASATATVDEDRVYVVWNEPDHYFLTALNHQGKTAWQRDFGPFISQHGSGSSPMLCDDKVILANFQDDPKFIEGPKPDVRSGTSSIIAVAASTGKTVWQTPRRSTVVSYSTPCLYEPRDGARTLIFNSQSHGISAMDPTTGKVLWEYEQAFDKRSVSSPIVIGDLIFGSSGSGGGGNVVTVINAREASPNHKPALAYQIKKAAAYVPTSIAKDNLAWIWSDAGIVTCLNAKTGEVHYQERVGGNYFGSPVWVDGRVFCVSKTGEIVVLEGTEKFNVLSRYSLNEVCDSAPAVALGRLFIRTEKHLWSFGGTKAQAVP
jgi:outer membrane protein assembly factor BamB